MHFAYRELQGGGWSLGARSWIPGEGETGRLGALLTTRPILILFLPSLRLAIAIVVLRDSW
eukprot:453503-Pelagomonas_calceolata.AAC.1